MEGTGKRPRAGRERPAQRGAHKGRRGRRTRSTWLRRGTQAGRGTRLAGTAARAAGVGTALGAALTLLAACAGLPGHASPAPLTSVGPGEGSLRLLGPVGYVQDGSTDPRVDWVTAFEHRTGCRVSFTQVPAAGSTSAMFRMRGTNYDGVLAPPVVAAQLIRAGLIAPLNTAIVAGATSAGRTLAATRAVTFKGQTYGIPYVWNAYVLGYATDVVRPSPRTLGALFDPASAARYARKILLPDSPLTIAMAALYLRSAQSALGITDPYELTARQFAASVGVLKNVRPSITQYYSQDPQVIGALAAGGAVLGAVLPRHVDTLAKAGRKVAGADLVQATTGWVSFWLMSAHAPAPNCMYEWLAWSLTPSVQQQVADWTGAAPVDPRACAGLGRQFCNRRHVGDPAYLSKVAFAHLPAAACGDGKRGCVGWAEWVRAWRSIVGSASG